MYLYYIVSKVLFTAGNPFPPASEYHLRAGPVSPGREKTDGGAELSGKERFSILPNGAHYFAIPGGDRLPTLDRTVVCRERKNRKKGT